MTLILGFVKLTFGVVVDHGGWLVAGWRFRSEVEDRWTAAVMEVLLLFMCTELLLHCKDKSCSFKTDLNVHKVTLSLNRAGFRCYGALGQMLAAVTPPHPPSVFKGDFTPIFPSHYLPTDRSECLFHSKTA